MRFISALLLVIAVLCGCDDDDEVTNPPAAKSLWPLKVGNEWTYENQVLDPAGAVLQYDTTVFQVAKDTVVEGATWYILTLNGARDSEVLPCRSRSDGVWAWDGASAFLFWKYPAAVGDSWIILTDTAAIEAVGESVTVPAGTFTCVNYKWTGSRDPDRVYQYHYMSPGVGRVKSDEYYKTAGDFVYVHFRDLLISYSLK